PLRRPRRARLSGSGKAERVPHAIEVSSFQCLQISVASLKERLKVLRSIGLPGALRDQMHVREIGVERAVECRTELGELVRRRDDPSTATQTGSTARGRRKDVHESLGAITSQVNVRTLLLLYFRTLVGETQR